MGKTRLGYDYALKRRLQYTGGVYLFSLETRTTFHNSIRENVCHLISVIILLNSYCYSLLL